MMVKKILFLCLLQTLGIFLFAQKTTTDFNISPDIPIKDVNGNSYTFEEFLFLSSHSDEVDILPTLNDKKQIIEIVLDIKNVALTHSLKTKTEAIAQKTEVKVKTENIKVEETSTPTATPQVVASEPYTPDFSFTNANQLEGMILPNFSEKGINGKVYDLESCKGKVIVIKFWFTACGPCIKELPILNDIVRKYKNKDIVFLAPAIDKLPAIDNFLNRHRFDYTILQDAIDFNADYKVAGYPTHIVVRKDGIIDKVIVGENSQTKQILQESISKCLAFDEQVYDVRKISDSESISITSDMTIITDTGEYLSEAQYLKKLTSGNYQPYLKYKLDGTTELLMINKY